MYTTTRRNIQQDMQYMYNVTMRRIPAANVAVEKQSVLNIMSVWL